MNNKKSKPTWLLVVLLCLIAGFIFPFVFTFVADIFEYIIFFFIDASKFNTGMLPLLNLFLGILTNFIGIIGVIFGVKLSARIINKHFLVKDGKLLVNSSLILLIIFKIGYIINELFGVKTSLFYWGILSDVVILIIFTVIFYIFSYGSFVKSKDK